MFDSRPTVAWPPPTVAWPFSDFYQNFPKSLETSKKRCLTVGQRSRDLRPLSRDRPATFFKEFPNCLKRRKNVVWQSADGRVTSAIVAWPFSDFFQNFPKSLETSKKRCLTVGRRSRDLRPFSHGITYCLADVYLVLIPSFRQKLGHVSPPTEMVRSWKFRHHIKARDRTKRISDFDGKIPTRWFPMRGTSSPL